MIIGLGASFSIFLVFVGVLFLCNSFLCRFLECWLSAGSFTDLFVMFKRDCWLMLEARKGGCPGKKILAIHKEHNQERGEVDSISTFQSYSHLKDGWWLSLWEFPSAQVGWHWGTSYGFLFLWRPSFLSPTLPKIPCVLCNVRLWALHLFQSGAGWRLSENNYAKLLSGSITKYILSIVRDWWLPMGWFSIWAGYSLVSPSFSTPYFCLYFL